MSVLCTVYYVAAAPQASAETTAINEKENSGEKTLGKDSLHIKLTAYICMHAAHTII